MSAAHEAGAKRIGVHVRDARLARTMERAITRAVADATRACEATVEGREPVPAVRLRTKRRLDALGDEAVRGAIAIVRVTARGARRLPEIVDRLRAADVAGVQLVWDGVEPPREQVERHVFAVLERARATPSGPPVVLARDPDPVFALRLQIAERQRKEPGRS